MQNSELLPLLQAKIDNKTKPPGSMGRLEEVAIQLGVIQGTMEPQIQNPAILVFAGDHGIAKTGLVNPYPAEVTAQMVLNFCRGGAAINALCKTNEIQLFIVDAGVDFDFDPSLSILHHKIRKGTRNYLEGLALTKEEVEKAIQIGGQIVANLKNNNDCNTVGFGEMGIGNTSSASLIHSIYSGTEIENCVGEGTGAKEKALETKKSTLRKVMNLHFPHFIDSKNSDPIDVLCKVGGLEIAMMVGAYLEAYKLKMTIVVDGYISTASFLLAYKMNPNIKEHTVFSHESGEKGHRMLLSDLQAKPLLQLGMRLGEGTGSAMAIPILRASSAILNDMASFAEAGVSNNQ